MSHLHDRNNLTIKGFNEFWKVFLYIRIKKKLNYWRTKDPFGRTRSRKSEWLRIPFSLPLPLPDRNAKLGSREPSVETFIAAENWQMFPTHRVQGCDNDAYRRNKWRFPRTKIRFWHYFRSLKEHDYPTNPKQSLIFDERKTVKQRERERRVSIELEEGRRKSSLCPTSTLRQDCRSNRERNLA